MRIAMIVGLSVGVLAPRVLHAQCSPAVIDAGTLDGENGLVITGAVPGGVLGWAVAQAGDIDGDGVADLILGAPHADDDMASGAAFVVFGRHGGFAPVLDPALLDGTDGFSVLGEQADRLGISVAGAGDMTGDGLDELAFGTARFWAHAYQAAYVVFGSSGAWPPVFDQGQLNGTNGFRLPSVYLTWTTGSRVASGGDVNGDGRGDALISIYPFAPQGYAGVVLGGASPYPTSLADLDGVRGFAIKGLGTAMSSAGDINGDGLGDVAIGDASLGGSAGVAYVLFGKSSGFPAFPGLIEVTTLDGTDGFVIEGAAPGDRAGHSLAPAGDLNADGIDDLLVGAPGAAAGDGAAYVVYGASAFSTPFLLSSVDGTNGVRITGNSGDGAGTAVAAAGDVNADGIDDAVLGAPGVTPASGRAYVVYGGALPSPLPVSGLAGSNGFTITGLDAGDATGFAVAGAGDVNADGHDDLLIGAPRADGAANSLPDAGEAYVVFGPALSMAPDQLPDGVAGIAYSLTFTAARGTPPYAFGTASALPPGLSLAPDGLLSGTPLQDGSYVLVVDVGDAAGCTAMRQYQLVVRPASDFVVGQGLGLPSLNRVRVFDAAGAATTVDFMAYAAGRWGVNVAAAAIDQDSADEILTGPGPGETFGPQVRAFQGTSTPVGRVSFYAYATLRFGVNVGAGDVDGDTFAEILTGSGPGAVFGPHVRGWNFDDVVLAPLSKISFFAYATLRWGVNVADGNVDADGSTELLTGPGPGPTFAPTVRGWNYDGAALTSIPTINFNPYAFRYGALLAGGDVDADGFAEIVTAPGPGPTSPAWYRGFDVDGGTLLPSPGFDANRGGAYGGRVGLGLVGGDPRTDLLTGAGRDPAATSTVTSYAYDGLSLTPLPNSFTPFSPGYGVNVSAGSLGY